MVEQQAVDVPAEMAEIYDDFYNTAGGSILSTTMTAGIPDIALGFDNDHAETSIRQNLEHENKGAEFMMVNVKPFGLREFITDTHSSLSLRDGHQKRGGQEHPYRESDGPDPL